MRKMNFPLLLIAFILLFANCTKTDPIVLNPFDIVFESSNDSRDKIVVISDLHLGNDLTYSETVKHLKRLEEFLNEVRTSSTVKELVIAGDMFDDWYIPTRIDTYGAVLRQILLEKVFRLIRVFLMPLMELSMMVK